MKEVKPDVSFPQVEARILQHWQKNKMIQKGLSANRGKTPFVFYDGPPFATGLPHYGHLLAGTLKDIVPRYWCMKGFYVERRWGWDCHGLPVEFEMENELGLKGHKAVQDYGVSKFNEACRGIVERYSKEWEQTVYRTGRWVDFENKYRTMDTPFMESVWWIIRQLWDKKLIYEDYRVMPYSWKLGTPLSNFEASLNYKEVQDPAITIRFKSLKHKRTLLAWTTTPWTLPANLALAVNKDVEYVELKDTQTSEHYVLAKDRIPAYFKEPKEYEIRSTFTGDKLEGETYEPLFPYFKDRAKEGAFRVLLGDHVTATDGTGIVHTAPAHGEEDFHVAKKYKIRLVDLADNEGNFTDQAAEFKGLNIKDADKEIIRSLKERKLLFRHDTLVHNYPFCWRSETPLMNKAIPAWFVKLEPLKSTLLKNNSQTRWVPDHLRDGRFGNWLENARDWNISRNRFWGTPIPVWRCQLPCDGIICVGSVEELQTLSGKKLTDIHKHFVDEITIPCPKCKKAMKRIPEVLDCWFESGAMPYAQQHYPFENKERFEKSFPADFIAEGIDQTRGWFYTLSVLSAALFQKPPFKNVIVNGLVLAEDGKKMSKRLKNYPDPKLILDTYGADALRAYLMNSPASHADDLRFSESGVKEIIRSVMLPFWNAYSFFVTYALADHWEPKSFSAKQLETLEDESDQWIVSRLHTLIHSVDEKMAVYRLYEVVPEVLVFIEDLTNWYIRINRRRFWEEGMSASKNSAFSTLYYVLLDFSKILAPILPFISEEIFLNLGTGESVHLESFPKLNKKWINADLESQVALVQKVCSMGRNIRSTQKLKVRQPLNEILVITQNAEDQKTVEKFTDVILQELNVKKAGFSSDEERYVSLSAKANAKVLGPRLGQKMKTVLAKAKELTPKEIKQAEKDGFIFMEGEKIGVNELTIERIPKVDGAVQTMAGVTVWLDTKLTELLISEGRARELVNRIQKLRKDLGFQVTDRIRVSYNAPKELAAAFDGNRDYVSSEVLAQSLTSKADCAWNCEQDIDGFKVKLFVEKV